jgi:hypothetical protein
MVKKRPLPDFSLSMDSLHTTTTAAVGGSSRIFLLCLVVSSCFVQASTSKADSKCRHGVWGVQQPSAFSSTTVGRFGLGLSTKSNVLCVRGGESSEEDKFQLEGEEEEGEDEMHPDEDEIIDIKVNELMDEDEQIMEDLEEDLPSEADGGVDDWAGDDADDEDVSAELIEEMNEVTGQFDEDEGEDDLDTQQGGQGQEADAKGFEEEADVDNISVEPEKTWETPESSFSREAATPNQAMDDGDSSAFVDRMELADDEGETTSGGFEAENESVGSGTASVAPGGDYAVQEEAQESASSAVPEQQASSGAQEEAQESTNSTVAEQQASAAPAPPTEISATTKDILMNELKYRLSEVEKMRPDVAKIVANKRLQRPTEGVPVNWFVAGKMPKRNGLLKILPKILVPVLVGALAVTTGIGFDLSPNSLLPAKKPQPPRPSLFVEYEISTPAEDAVEVDDDDTKATEEQESKPDDLPANEQVNAPSKVHAHSIKPGHRPAADVVDVTWLDKGITAIERTIKSFLGWEI